MQHKNEKMDRRDFMKSSALAAAGAVAAVSTTASAAEEKEVALIKANKNPTPERQVLETP